MCPDNNQFKPANQCVQGLSIDTRDSGRSAKCKSPLRHPRFKSFIIVKQFIDGSIEGFPGLQGVIGGFLPLPHIARVIVSIVYVLPLTGRKLSLSLLLLLLLLLLRYWISVSHQAPLPLNESDSGVANRLS
jgi:hypothetical protein